MYATVVLGELLQGLLPLLKHTIVQRLTCSLYSLGWPALLEQATWNQSSSGGLDMEGAKGRLTLGQQCSAELRMAIADVLVLQYACDHRVATHLGAPARLVLPRCDEVMDSDCELWAVAELLAPLLTRFHFHFGGCRESNRRGRPELMFSHCASVLRLHAFFLTSTLPAMMRRSLALLHTELVGAAATRSEARDFMDMLARGCPRGALTAVANGLFTAIISKLLREQPTLLASPRLFCHKLNETIAFEREVCESLKLPSGRPLVLHHFQKV